ncbi:RING/U-box superfamily protein [Perilla frutescens var. hirtella]|nr:RING/U-box superfamily protein [Perilla frutescens var. hirtella]
MRRVNRACGPRLSFIWGEGCCCCRSSYRAPEGCRRAAAAAVVDGRNCRRRVAASDVSFRSISHPL